MTDWLTKLEKLEKEAVTGRGRTYYSHDAGKYIPDLENIEGEIRCHLRNRSREIAALVKQAETVAEFFEGRWCEDHAYRERFLKPLRDALSNLLRDDGR